jgi:hypothetical protein
MKKKTASNPLKFFNDNKAKAYKRGGDVMKAFKKSLPTAQMGTGYVNDMNYYDPKKTIVDSLRINNSYPQYKMDNNEGLTFIPKPKLKPVNNSGPGSGMGSMYMNEMLNEIPMNKKGGAVKKKKK